MFAVYFICLVYLDLIQPQPAPTDMELSPDFYEDSTDPYLEVATVANSKFYSAKTFEAAPGAPDTAMFKLLPSLDPETVTFWAALKQCEPKDVVLWYDFDSLGLIIFDAGLGPSIQKLALKVT